MTIIDDALTELIAEFGETVTIIPTAGYETVNEVWEQDAGFQDGEAYESEARLFRQATNFESLPEGYADNADAVAQFDDETVEQGDKVIFDNEEWVVSATFTHQLGGGPYRQVVTLQRAER